MGDEYAYLVMGICVFGNANMCNWQCQDTGAMNRSPTPGGMFAPHFVGERWYFTECLLVFCGVFCVYFVGVRGFFTVCSLHYRRPSAAFSQTVRSRRGPIYRARIYVYTHKMTNGNVCVMMWKCVFNNVKTRI